VQVIRERDPRKKKRDSKRQEARIADLLGGSVQAGSGSSMFAKGDVRRGGVSMSDRDFLTECKRTERENLTIRGEWLSKITREALAVGKHPALSIEVSLHDSLVEQDWVLIPASMFRRLISQEEQE
jgi:hypothetical protein